MSESVDYAGPDMALDAGTFTLTETVGYAGPDLELDGGTWTANEVASYSGPELELDAGTFSVSESVFWSGPDLELDGGTFTTAQSVSYSGPDLELHAGSWTANEVWAGPDIALDAGTFSVSESVDYAGPDMALDAGAFSVSESQGYSGPDLELDAGSWSVTQIDSLITDGTIRALAADATGGFVAGGNFTKAYFNKNDRGGGDVLSISNATRTALAYVNGAIHAMVSDGAGGVYIGGEFTYVAGVARVNLARILSNGTVSSWDPGCNGPVYVLARSNSANGVVVYAGGQFSVCGGLTRYNLAQISESTGAASASWYAHTSKSGSYADAAVYALEMGTTSGGAKTNNLCIGGHFTAIQLPAGSYARTSAAGTFDAAAPTIYAAGTWAFTLSDGTPGTVYALYLFWSGGIQYQSFGGSFARFGAQTKTNWALWNYSGANISGATFNTDGPIYTMSGPNVGAAHTIYVGGGFTTASGVSRSNIMAYLSNAPSPVQPTSWNPSASGAVRAIARDGSFIYAGGDFATFGGRSAKRIAKCSTASSTAESWNTALDVYGASVRAVLAGTLLGGSNVVAGGIDMTTDFVTRQCLLNVTGEGAFGNVNSAVSGAVYALHRHGDTVYVGGQFSAVGGVTGYKGLAKLDIVTGALDSAWKPLSGAASPRFNALAYHNGAVFAGGSEVKKADATTGVIDGAWTPTVSGTVNAFHLHGGKLVIGDNSLRAVDLTTGATATWADASAFSVRAMTRVDDTLYTVGSVLERYAFDTGVRDIAWTPQALAGAQQGVAVTDQYIYIGANASTWAWRLNLDGSNTGLALLAGGDVLAVITLSGNFALFGGAMTLASSAQRPVRSLVYLVET